MMLGAPSTSNNPSTCCAFLDATSQRVGWGWDVARTERHGGARRAGERPFSARQPRPASCSNGGQPRPRLTRWRRAGHVTGTGGFLVEAALMGHDTVAMDLDPMMVDGASANLEWALEGRARRASGPWRRHRLADLLARISPRPHRRPRARSSYGRNSHGSHGPWDLLARVLASAAEVVSQQGQAVTGPSVKPFAMEDGSCLAPPKWSRSMEHGLMSSIC